MSQRKRAAPPLQSASSGPGRAVLDSSELTLSKLVAKVLRLEKLGKLALSSLNAVRAEQADKDETDRHMEVGEERDAQIKNILRSLEKFEAVCSMIHTATSAKACEPLVKQVRNKKKRSNTPSPIKLSTSYQLSTIDCPIKLTPFRSCSCSSFVSFRNISHAASGGLCASARPRRRDPRPDQAARPRPHQPRRAAGRKDLQRHGRTQGRRNGAMIGNIHYTPR